MTKIGLSKSKITMWRQCPKRLWLDKYKRELALVGADITTRMETGHRVGEIAQSYFPDGVLIDDESLTIAIEKTKPLIKTKKAIFEATLEHEGLLVRADLLIPVRGGYRLIEVKSSGGMKDYYKDDFTIQKYVFENNGVKIKSVELACIDTLFVYQGDGDYSGLLKFINVDEIVSENIANVPNWVKGARAALSGDEPEISCGKHCNQPFECPFIDYCSKYIGKEAPIFGLDMYSRLGAKKVEELETKGIVNGLEVPDEYLNATNKRIKEITLAGEYHLSPAAKTEIEQWPFPRYYFDFETIGFTIPRWANTSPFQQIPFQWSCHVEHENGSIQHFDFLDASGEDPRRKCAEKLIEILGKSGTIIAYHSSFEKGRISELAELFPDLAGDLLSINDRVEDLLPIMRAHYYHPEMRGSWSIKAVLPTIAPELSYENLEVGNGGDAQEAYLEITNPQTPSEIRETIKNSLLKYCEQDTLAMVKIVEFIRNNAK